MSSQLKEFWDQIGTADSEIEHLYGFLLERGTPLATRELAAHLIEWRVREEEKHLQELAARRSPIYRPKNKFEVGQTVLFTVMGNREGTVKEIRPGNNPRLGNFDVMRVQLEGESQTREFAMGYEAAHPLNEEVTQTAISLGVTPAEAIAAYGEMVQNTLEQRLSRDKEFVKLNERWFLKGLMPEIHVGYLNLAEAAIEQAGDALPTAELEKILDLPPGPKKSASEFSLNYALQNDGRFENVGPTGEPRWILVRMELPEAREFPAILKQFPARSVRLPAELETIAVDLYDTSEANGGVSRPQSQPRDEVTIVLTYPHRRAGTVPLIPPLRAMLPSFNNPRLKLNLIDASSQEKFPGYAVNEGNYLAGLANLYNSRRLSPGAYITIRRGPGPLSLVVEYQPQREKSLWVRVARNLNGQLTFAQEKRPLSHKYDEEMLIVVADPVGMDTLGQKAREQRPLPTLLEEIFPELAKLSGAGRVHAKTLYSAVNLLRRTPPRAVLSALTEVPSLSSVGGGYFVLADEARR